MTCIFMTCIIFHGKLCNFLLVEPSIPFSHSFFYWEFCYSWWLIQRPTTGQCEENKSLCIVLNGPPILHCLPQTLEIQPSLPITIDHSSFNTALSLMFVSLDVVLTPRSLEGTQNLVVSSPVILFFFSIIEYRDKEKCPDG